MKVRASALPEEVEELGEFHGSNVELEWESGQVHRELAVRAHLQDAAMRDYQGALRTIPARRQDYRLRYGPALARLVNKHDQVTVAKAMAEHECRVELRALEDAIAERDAASERLRSLQSQLTAAQTRARIWQAQFSLEVRGPH